MMAHMAGANARYYARSKGTPAPFRNPENPDKAAALKYIAEGDQALEWLEKSCDARSGWLTWWAKGDPRPDELRPDPRFQKILGRLGLGQ